MNPRWKTVALATAVAAVATLATSALVGRGGDDPVSAQPGTVPPSTTPGEGGQAADDGAMRTIAVTGTGKVSVTPDVATISMGVQVTAPTSKAALDQVGAQSQTLVDALKGLGVADEDLQTSGLSLWPQYDNDGKQVEGYQASTEVTITVRDIDRLGEIIDGASSFVDQNLTLGGISFSYEDPESVLADARTAAIANAREKAAQYAEAAGVEVGDVVRIAETSAVDEPVYFAEATAADAAGSRVAIEPGSQDLSVDVTVVFAMQ